MLAFIKPWGKFLSQYYTADNVTVLSPAVAAFILNSMWPRTRKGSIPDNNLLQAIRLWVTSPHVVEDQSDHSPHLDSLGTLRNGSYLIYDRHNKVVDTARFMHFFSSVKAAYSGNKHFQNCCVTSKLGMVDVRTLQFFPWLKSTHQEN